MSNSELRANLLRHARKDIALVFAKKGITPSDVKYNGANADAASVEYYFKIFFPNGQSLNYTIVCWEWLFKEELPDIDARANLDKVNVSYENKIRLRIMWAALEAYKHFKKAYEISPQAWDNIKPLARGVVEIEPTGHLKYKLLGM